MGQNLKALLIQLSGEVFIIGGSISAMIASLFVINPSVFGPGAISLESMPTFLALPFLLLTVCSGMISGIALWVLTVRRFSDKNELERYLTEPYIPLASDLMRQVFNVVYNAVHKPYRLGEP
jgi:hypothetical protein